MDRDQLLRQVTTRLGKRTVVWAGLRNDDVESLRDLPNLGPAFSIIGGHAPHGETTYESIEGVRHDLELWNIDQHLTEPAAREFRRALLRGLDGESALVPYRPSMFLSAVWFARMDRCTNLGLFGDFQAAFDHKPWVETNVGRLGLATIPWTYIADEEQLKAVALVERGPVVLRRSRTSGGEGLYLAHDRAELAERWLDGQEAFMSVGPYIEDAVSLNIGATAWHDGVSVHHMSVQLVGIESCVTRPFGYCGNDFGAGQDLGAQVHDSVEEATNAIGGWLRSFGYLGTFGVDYLLKDGVLVFTEINPRFQGSTSASSRLGIQAGEGCLLLEHIASHLGCPAPRPVRLRDRMESIAPLATVVLHHLSDESAAPSVAPLFDRLRQDGVDASADVTVAPGQRVEQGGVLTRLSVRDRVTTSGLSLIGPVAQAIEAWRTDQATGGLT